MIQWISRFRTSFLIFLTAEQSSGAKAASADEGKLHRPWGFQGEMVSMEITNVVFT